jgi:uncharacterized protein YndB with AHSA1/START domain
MELKFQVQTRIQKPVEEVYDAVHNPEKLRGYFTNGGASGPLNEGTTVQWAFADNPDEPPASFPVTVLIVLEWQGASDHNTRVEMKFEKGGPDSTIVRITETGWEENQDDLDRSYMNCMGWSQMVSALKAYVEYGINLRKGAYEGLYKAEDHGSAANAA